MVSMQSIYTGLQTFPPRNLARVPEAGRNWEGAGGDAYLSGEVSYETILGIQSQGVQAWFVVPLMIGDWELRLSKRQTLHQ